MVESSIPLSSRRQFANRDMIHDSERAAQPVWPRSVIAMDDLLPGGPAFFKQTRVDSASMLRLIGALDLDLDCAGVCAPGHIQPGAARDRHWVDRVGDDEGDVGVVPRGGGQHGEVGHSQQLALDAGANADAASDSVATVYHDMTNPAFWSTFDLTVVSPSAKGFVGAAFDGRYVYLVPANNGSRHGLVTRQNVR